jgi:multidrug efflux pump subunit AcrA (membrane-fusion protein)
MSFVSRIKVGDSVDIRVDSMDRTLHGVVARFSRKVETSTRSMDAEVDVPNEDLSLIPGIYATAVLKADHRTGVLLAPIGAVVREKEGGSVYVITKDNKIEERKAKLGVETPSMIEILSGVNENEMLFIGSRAKVKPGQEVEPKLLEAAKPQAESKPLHTAKAS